MEQLCWLLEQQEQHFVAWMEELGQTIGEIRETYGTRVSRNITHLDELIGELEAKQCQPEWELMQVGVADLPLPAVPRKITSSLSSAHASQGGPCGGEWDLVLVTHKASCAQTPLMNTQELRVAQHPGDILASSRRDHLGLGTVLMQAPDRLPHWGTRISVRGEVPQFC